MDCDELVETTWLAVCMRSPIGMDKAISTFAKSNDVLCVMEQLMAESFGFHRLKSVDTDRTYTP